MSQSDKGGLVFGGDIDGYNSYAQRGNLPVIEHVIACAVTLFPVVSRLRLLRHWAGLVDMTMDGSPIIAPGPVEGMYLNAGWNYVGFKATPASGLNTAKMLVEGVPEIIAPFSYDRFRESRLLGEKAAASVGS